MEPIEKEILGPPPQGNGLDLGREELEIRGDEWVFGAVSQPCLYAIPEATREPYLPKGEVQRGKEDFMDCATRAPNNILAPKFTYAYDYNLIKPENIKWLEDNGYVKEGKIDFSDRYIAVLSGTTRQGNSLKGPIDAIHKYGLIPKSMLPASKDMTFDQYHDLSKITQEMQDLGKEFAKRWSINYEQVREIHFNEALKDDFIDVAAYAWPFPVNGEYPKNSGTFNHAFAIFKTPKYFIFDNYLEQGTTDDYVKKLAQNYDFYEYGYRVYVSAENVPSVTNSFSTLITEWFKRFMKWFDEGQQGPMPPVPEEPKPNQKKEELLQDICLAIKKHEGWATPGQTLGGVFYPKGSLSFRCNNPGNARYYAGGYLPKYGVVVEYKAGLTLKPGQRGFAKFKDYATGYMYLRNLVLQKAVKHPTWNLYQFFGDVKEGWAPDVDNNNSRRYAEVVAKAMGVNVTTWRIKNLL